jgi:hypothetical protein
MAEFAFALNEAVGGSTIYLLRFARKVSDRHYRHFPVLPCNGHLSLLHAEDQYCSLFLQAKRCSVSVF